MPFLAGAGGLGGREARTITRNERREQSRGKIPMLRYLHGAGHPCKRLVPKFGDCLSETRESR